MHCEKINDALISRSLGLLPVAEMRDLEAHLEACPECRRQADLIANALRALECSYTYDPPADMLERILERAEIAAVSHRPFREWFLPVLAAAASFALLACSIQIVRQPRLPLDYYLLNGRTVQDVMQIASDPYQSR